MQKKLDDIYKEIEECLAGEAKQKHDYDNDDNDKKDEERGVVA